MSVRTRRCHVAAPRAWKEAKSWRARAAAPPRPRIAARSSAGCTHQACAARSGERRRAVPDPVAIELARARRGARGNRRPRARPPRTARSRGQHGVERALERRRRRAASRAARSRPALPRARRRRCGPRRARAPRAPLTRSSAASSSPCTVRTPPACTCQPAKPVPSYSSVRRKFGTSARGAEARPPRARTALAARQAQRIGGEPEREAALRGRIAAQPRDRPHRVAPGRGARRRIARILGPGLDARRLRAARARPPSDRAGARSRAPARRRARRRSARCTAVTPTVGRSPSSRARAARERVLVVGAAALVELADARQQSKATGRAKTPRLGQILLVEAARAIPDRARRCRARPRRRGAVAAASPTTRARPAARASGAQHAARSASAGPGRRHEQRRVGRPARAERRPPASGTSGDAASAPEASMHGHARAQRLAHRLERGGGAARTGTRGRGRAARAMPDLDRDTPRRGTRRRAPSERSLAIGTSSATGERRTRRARRAARRPARRSRRRFRCAGRRAPSRALEPLRARDRPSRGSRSARRCSPGSSRSAVRWPAVEHAATASRIALRGLGRAERVLEQHRRREDRRERVGDGPGPRCRAPSRAPARRGRCRPRRGSPRAACRASP